MFCRCEFKATQKTIYDNTDIEVAKNRSPYAVYCKFDVAHVFTNILDC
jgi:hypothetical protein